MQGACLACHQWRSLTDASHYARELVMITCPCSLHAMRIVPYSGCLSYNLDGSFAAIAAAGVVRFWRW